MSLITSEKCTFSLLQKSPIRDFISADASIVSGKFVVVTQALSVYCSEVVWETEIWIPSVFPKTKTKPSGTFCENSTPLVFRLQHPLLPLLPAWIIQSSAPSFPQQRLTAREGKEKTPKEQERIFKKLAFNSIFSPRKSRRAENFLAKIMSAIWYRFFKAKQLCAN